MKLRVGIFFGGPSREREVSFTGGRTVYDNLDQSLFEPVPVFVDSYGHFILLDWPHLHKKAIRDFYPPAVYRPASANEFPIYIESLGRLPSDELDLMMRKIGKVTPVGQLAQVLDLAFMVMPSELREGALIQSLLEAYGIPYTGSGPEGTQTCLDETLEKKWMAEKGYNTPVGAVIQREKWTGNSPGSYYEAVVKQLGFPLTVRPAHYSSGSGRTQITAKDGLDGFVRAMDKAFFQRQLTFAEWEGYSHAERLAFIQAQTDLQTGLGFPIDIHVRGHVVTAYHPERLLAYFNEVEAEPGDVFTLESHLSESKVIVEKAVTGQAFSCLVVRRQDGSAVSLLPMERDGKAGQGSTGSALDASGEQLHAIRTQCEKLFTDLHLQAFAQIDGVLAPDNRIYWQNIDTTPTLAPGNLLYHQAAVIGLTPSQFLTYLIRISLQERTADQLDASRSKALLAVLDGQMEQIQRRVGERKRVAVIIGGGEEEDRQQSLESGRNIFEKLDASEKYAPFPVYLSGKGGDLRLHLFPLGFLLLNDAQTLRRQIDDHRPHPELENIRLAATSITARYASELIQTGVEEINLGHLKGLADAAFISLTARAGADGPLQKALEEREIAYTGSNAVASALLANRYQTLDTLKKNGIKTPEQLVIKKAAYEYDPQDVFSRIESRFSYPMVVKPTVEADDPDARAIRNRGELESYVRLLFRPEGQEGAEARRLLQLRPAESVPRHDALVVETPMPTPDGKQVMKIEVGLLAGLGEHSEPAFDVFDPTEVLSGEATNVTPARLGSNRNEYNAIVRQIRQTMENAARILNIQGYATMEALVRIRSNQGVETTITGVQALPSLAAGNDIFQQAAHKGYPPQLLIDKILTFALRRQAVEMGLPFTSTVVARPVGIEQKMETPANQNEPRPSARPSQSGPTFTSSSDTGRWAALKSRAKVFLAEFLRFAKSPIFIRNVGALVLLLLAIYWLLQLWLRVYTHHNQSLQVDDYTGMRIEDAIRKAKRNSFSVALMDSFYMVDRPAGIVLEQTPKPLSRVKENRTIYLIVTKRTPDEVTLPGLVGNYDYYQYARKLQRLNVRTKIREKQFSSKLEENTILYLYHDGMRINEDDLKRGVKVPMGSVVEFVITQRNTGMVAIPDLVCKKYDAAVFLVTSMNLNIGRVYGEVTDQENAYVYKQEPDFSAGVEIPMGTAIDIYLTANRPSGCEGE